MLGLLLHVSSVKNTHLESTPFCFVSAMSVYSMSVRYLGSRCGRGVFLSFDTVQWFWLAIHGNNNLSVRGDRRLIETQIVPGLVSVMGYPVLPRLDVLTSPVKRDFFFLAAS